MQFIRILLFSCIFIVSAHYAGGQQFNGGLMAGVAGTQVAGDSLWGFHKAGIFAGGFVNLRISNHSAFQMELEYFQKGSRKNPDPEMDDYDQYLFRVNYVELPVFYQYILNDRFKFEAGPSLGFMINYYEERRYEEIKGGNPAARVSFQLNAGFYVSLTRRLMFSMRTNNSMLNIRADNATGDIIRIFPGNFGQFHDCLVMSIFYQFKDAW